MPLSTIRTRFLRATGDYSLKRDNVYDQFINSGQKLLDSIRLRHFKKQRTLKSLTAGDTYTSVLYYLMISEVWLADADGRYAMDARSIDYMRDNYGYPSSDITQAKPTDWALGNVDLSAESYGEDASQHDAEEIIWDPDGETTQTFNVARIVTMPPADATYTLHIEGQFLQPPLSAATDVSFWTEQYPELLIAAAKYFYEFEWMDNDTRATAIRKNLEYTVRTMLDRPSAMQNSNKLHTRRRVVFKAY